MQYIFIGLFICDLCLLHVSCMRAKLSPLSLSFIQGLNSAWHMENSQYIFGEQMNKKEKSCFYEVWWVTKGLAKYNIWKKIFLEKGTVGQNSQGWWDTDQVNETVISSSQASSSLHEWRKLNFWSWKLSHLEEVSEDFLSGVTSIAQIFAGWQLQLTQDHLSVPSKEAGFCVAEAHVHWRGRQEPFRKGGVWAMVHSSLVEWCLALFGCPSWVWRVSFLPVSVKWP